MRERTLEHIFLMESDKITSRSPVSFTELGVEERKHLEKWVVENPDILGCELLIITTEFDRFDKSDKRLDVLALDKQGKAAVVELKREAAGSLADLQAVRYAAFCSQMTLAQVVKLRAEHAKVAEEEAEQQIRDFVERDDFKGPDTQPRIILAAGSFDDEELTSCVLWLRSFRMDISCVEITPYKYSEGTLVLVPRVIIPLPEAEDYIVRAEIKKAEEADLSELQRLYGERNNAILAHFRTLFPERAPLKPARERVMQIPTGYGRIHFEWWWHRAKEAGKVLDVAVHFETSSGKRNQELCDFLKSHSETIRAAVGVVPSFEPNWTRKWASVYIRRSCEPWSDEVTKWAAETMDRLIRCVQPLLDEFHRRDQAATHA
jgi:hypothetical protein